MNNFIIVIALHCVIVTYRPTDRVSTTIRCTNICFLLLFFSLSISSMSEFFTWRRDINVCANNQHRNKPYFIRPNTWFIIIINLSSPIKCELKKPSSYYSKETDCRTDYYLSQIYCNREAEKKTRIPSTTFNTIPT